jgi:hypothetical protein
LRGSFVRGLQATKVFDDDYRVAINRSDKSVGLITVQFFESIVPINP